MSAPSTELRPPPAFRAEGRRRELARVLRRKRRLRAGTVQLLGAVVALGLAFVMPQVPIGYEISTSRAIEMLVAVGAGTVTFIGIVFSLLFLVVQFGTTTFTPRLNLFRDDPLVWRSFAFYTSVTVYAFAASLVIGQDERTSGIVPIVAFAGVLGSIVLYRRLTMGAFASIQLAPALSQVARRGREVIDGLYVLQAPCGQSEAENAAARIGAAAGPVEEPVAEIRWPHPSAVAQVIDVPRVLRAAEHHGVAVDFRVGSGDTLAEGAVVAVVRGGMAPQLEGEVLRALTVGVERTFEQDPAFALRVLADIALRALSPAVNDPTTAVQALDAIDDLLRVLLTRELDVGNIVGADGTIRVRLVLPTWDEYLAVSLDEIIALPMVSPNVSRRIVRMLDELETLAPQERQPPLQARHVRSLDQRS